MKYRAIIQCERCGDEKFFSVQSDASVESQFMNKTIKGFSRKEIIGGEFHIVCEACYSDSEAMKKAQKTQREEFLNKEV